MHKQFFVGALLAALATIGPLKAQTIENPNDVPMPPVIEMPVEQLAALRSGSGSAALLGSIADWLSRDFALPPNYYHPRIEFASPQAMLAIRYRAFGVEKLARALADAGDDRLSQQMRDVMALYEDATRTIYLRQDWTGATPSEISVLVHEMVHHLQNVAGLKYDCAEAREKPAYAAQIKFLELSGHNFFEDFETDPMSLTMRTVCGF
jgi:hypothetical protein